MQVGYEPASLEEFFNDFDDDNFLSEGDEDDLEDVTRDRGLRSPPPASTQHSTAPRPSGYAAVSYPKSLTRPPPPPPSPLHSNTTPAPPKR